MRKRRTYFRKGQYVYEIDGVEVTQEEFHSSWYVPPPDYEKGECPTVRPDLDDFSQENGGRGRFNPQLAKFPGDQSAYYRSVGEVKDEAKRRGYGTETE